MFKTDNLLWGAVALLVLAIAATAVYKSLPLLRPVAVATAPLDPACDLRQGPCTSTPFEGAAVSLSIEPRSIPVVQPLQLEVVVENLDPQEVTVDFSGVDMNMGFNRASLEARGGGRHVGTAMLPVCVRSRMEWEATVMLETGSGLVTVPYRFETFAP